MVLQIAGELLYPENFFMVICKSLRKSLTVVPFSYISVGPFGTPLKPMGLVPLLAPPMPGDPEDATAAPPATVTVDEDTKAPPTAGVLVTAGNCTIDDVIIGPGAPVVATVVVGEKGAPKSAGS